MWNTARTAVLLFAAVTVVSATGKAGPQRKVLSSPAQPENDEVYRVVTEKDFSSTCWGEGDTEICCRNCTSCCKDHNDCNFGENNHGWGNIGSNNFGDFNFANNSRGDCNIEDNSFGIGGPEYSGCPQETWDHIVRFCAVHPYYHKCYSPPDYFGEELMDRMRGVVLSCDKNIPVKPKPQKVVHAGRRGKRFPGLQKVRVARDMG